MNLAVYQQHFLHAVRHDTTPSDFSAVVRGGGSLSPEGAVNVYRKMYWYRLVDAHFDLFPRTARLLGAKQFTREVCACLTAQPSRTTVIERLALPFARFFADRDFPRESRELALLEALGIESLLSEDPRAPLFTRSDAESPDLAERRVRAVPSLRAAIVCARAVGLFQRMPREGEISEHPMSVEIETAAETGDVGVVFCRPDHSVFHYRVSTSEVRILESLDLFDSEVPVGEWLVALAGDEGNVNVAFERCAFYLDRKFLERAEQRGENR